MCSSMYGTCHVRHMLLCNMVPTAGCVCQMVCAGMRSVRHAMWYKQYEPCGRPLLYGSSSLLGLIVGIRLSLPKTVSGWLYQVEAISNARPWGISIQGVKIDGPSSAREQHWARMDSVLQRGVHLTIALLSWMLVCEVVM